MCGASKKSPAMARVVPAILERDEQTFRKRVATIASHLGEDPLIQIDVLDGTMLPGRSFGDPAAVAALRLATPFEAHLMVNDPEEAAREWTRAGARRVVVHLEAKGNLGLALERIRHDDRVPGMALNPDTDLRALDEFIPFIHYILVMGVSPGGQGRGFVPETVDRVRALRRAYPDRIIGVDGGVTDRNHLARTLARAGADDLIVGSAIWRADDPLAAYRSLVTDAHT